MKKPTPLEKTTALLWHATMRVIADTDRIAKLSDRCLTAELRLLADAYAATLSASR